MESIENQQVEKRLQEFTEYFVEEFDTRIEFYRKVLEEKADPATGGYKTAALSGSKQAIAGGVSFATGIPFLGPLIGAIYEQGGKKIVTSLEEKGNKKEANSLYDLIYNYKDKESAEKYKRTLIEASYEVFYSFEAQFMNATVEKGGETRAMLKLAKCSATKTIENFINNDVKFTVEDIFKSVTSLADSKFKKYVSVFKLGRTILKKNDDKSKWNTVNILSKCGIQMEVDNKITYYTTSNLDPNEYGFRKISSCENKDEIIKDFEITDLKNNIQYNFSLSLENKQDYVDSMYKKLFERDPKKMEDRIKETCNNAKLEILNTIEKIFVDDLSSELSAIKNIISKAEKDILNEICIYYVKSKNQFDAAKNDRQNKHDQTINKLNENTTCLEVIDVTLKKTLNKVDDIQTNIEKQKSKPFVFQLPHLKSPFIGRQNELNEIRENYINSKITVITGPKGIGKTDLAKKFAFTIKQEMNANIIWINCDNNESLVYSLRDLALLLDFNMDGKTNLEIIQDIFTHFETKQTIFIFDNCYRNSVLVNNFTNYFNISATMFIILTSTYEFWNESYRIIPLQKWSISETTEYIKSIFTRELEIELTNDDSDCVELAEFHDCLPIRLYNATSYIIQENNLLKETFTIKDYIMRYSQKVIVFPPAPICEPQNNDVQEDEDPILRKVEKEGKRFGKRVGNEAERIGKQVSNEADRFGNSVSNEADRFGNRVSNETHRIGNQISNEAARAEKHVKKFFKKMF